MQVVIVIFVMLLFASLCSCNNVMDYGAVGDGKTDDSEAFLKAWNVTCGSTGSLEVPVGKTFMLNPLKFSGPCKLTSVNFKLGGNIVAPQSTEAWGNDKGYWIEFDNINGLIFNGGGQIDGQGYVWWNICNDDSCQRPKALHFHNCQYLNLSGTRHLNSAKGHISINSCNHTTVSDLTIMAPKDSPNTDGIDISDTSDLTIQDSNISTGDDCIAMNGGTSNVNITNINCGPGHGISIGSLGKNGAYEVVEHVYVGYSSFNGRTNGLRIKTWQGGSGYVRNVTFEHINITNTKNPIIIDQHYMDLITVEDDEKQLGSGLEISGVTYRDVHGTSATKVAINFDCSSSKGCMDILLDSVNLTLFSSSSIPCNALCNNAKGKAKSVSPVVPCLEMINHYY